MSDPSAPFSKLSEERLRKKCLDKQITAQDPWPSIRLLNIKPLGIMHHGARLHCISGLSSNLYLPIIVANPRSTNPSTLKSPKRWWMINITGSHLFGCKV
jgi:hypothetical protein